LSSFESVIATEVRNAIKQKFDWQQRQRICGLTTPQFFFYGIAWNTSSETLAARGKIQMYLERAAIED
jgi:hypothetical protein